MEVFDGYPVLADVHIELTGGVELRLDCTLASQFIPGKDGYPPGDIKYLECSFEGILVPDKTHEQVYIFRRSFAEVVGEFYAKCSINEKQEELNKHLAVIKSDFVHRLQNLDDDTPEMEAYVSRHLTQLGIH